MAAGELSAGFDANARIGRSGSPTGGWKEIEADYPELFPNAAELEAAWYRKTGIYPMHGTIVVKDYGAKGASLGGALALRRLHESEGVVADKAPFGRGECRQR